MNKLFLGNLFLFKEDNLCYSQIGETALVSNKSERRYNQILYDCGDQISENESKWYFTSLTGSRILGMIFLVT